MVRRLSPESHEQDGERLSRRRECGEQQRPAILPWRFEPSLNARPILIDLAGRRRRFLPPDQLSERKRIRFG